MTPAQLESCTREQRLAWFAQQVIRASFDGLDIGSDDVQEWACSARLVHSETVTNDTDLSGVANAEFMGIGDEFFREARDLHDALPSNI